ncbi:Crp/Fnr family transcriptional regulator [Natronohydrobacter thiooxidans]|uniref:Crp/Fnr family transcriptional regulator n=1 Tax=Natronohydrobacter thiooxidans TaxID=87172 RepID=UPI001114F504|nr:Crp/Fnr family transcriptional regulator [Natronohydrobacter thiooxidans]
MPFSAEELSFMMKFRSGEVRLAPGEVLFHEGDESAYFYTALEGQGVRVKHLLNGERQVVNLIFPGDVVGLQASLAGGASSTAIASSPMVLCRFEKRRLHELYCSSPDRAYALTWIAAVEEHFLGETIATLGQRDATQRVAWALLKIYNRLSAVGLAQEAGDVPLPLRQRDLADAMGLSLVHTNKTLARLRPLARWENGRLWISDAEALAEIAMTDCALPPDRPLL